MNEIPSFRRPSQPAPDMRREQEPLLEYGLPGAQRLAEIQALQQQAAACLRLLAERTPHPLINRLLVAINVAVFALMVLSGVDLMMPSVDDLRAWGALNSVDVFAGQWWRMVTAMFLHIGLVHLLMNMWALWAIGPFVERLLGNVGFAVTYFVSGLVGSLASLYWNVDVVSAGASGAIFGVFGGILGFSIRQRNVLPRPLLQPLWSQSVTFVIVNAVLGMSIPGIDLAAHMGGLVAGVLCSFAISQPLDAPAGSLSLRALLVTGVSAVIVYGGVRLVEYSHRDSQSRLAVVDKLEAASARLQQSALAYRAKRLSADEFIDILEQEVLPTYRQAIRTLPEPENVDQKQRAPLVDLRMKILASISLVTELNEALHSQDDDAIASAVRTVLGDGIQ